MKANKNNNSANGVKNSNTNSANANRQPAPLAVSVQFFDVKKYAAIGNNHTPGVWILYKRGEGKTAIHLFGADAVAPNKTKDAVNTALGNVINYIYRERGKEFAAKQNNPDIKSKFRPTGILDIFVMTEKGDLIHRFDYNSSPWENTAAVPSDRIFKMNSKGQKVEKHKAKQETFRLLGGENLPEYIDDEIENAAAPAPAETEPTAPAPTGKGKGRTNGKRGQKPTEPETEATTEPEATTAAEPGEPAPADKADKAA